MNEEKYNEVDELEAERRILINEELKAKASLEKNLSAVCYFAVFLMITITVLIIMKILVIFGIFGAIS